MDKENQKTKWTNNKYINAKMTEKDTSEIIIKHMDILQASDIKRWHGHFEYAITNIIMFDNITIKL